MVLGFLLAAGCIPDEPTYDRDSCAACHKSPWGSHEMHFYLHNDPDNPDDNRYTRLIPFHDAHDRYMSLTDPLECDTCHIIPAQGEDVYDHVDGVIAINTRGPYITAWRQSDHSCQSGCHGNVWMRVGLRSEDYPGELEINCITCHTGDKFAQHVQGMPREYCYHCHNVTMNPDGSIKLAEHIIDLKPDNSFDVDVLTGNVLCSACHKSLPDSHNQILQQIGRSEERPLKRLEHIGWLLTCSKCHPNVHADNVFAEPHARHFPTIDPSGQTVEGETEINFLSKKLICKQCHKYIPETGAHSTHVNAELGNLIVFMNGFSENERERVAYHIGGMTLYSCPTCHLNEPKVEAENALSDTGLLGHMTRNHVALRGLAAFMTLKPDKDIAPFDPIAMTCFTRCHCPECSGEEEGGEPNNLFAPLTPSWNEYWSLLHPEECAEPDSGCVEFISRCQACHTHTEDGRVTMPQPHTQLPFTCTHCHPGSSDAPPPGEDGEQHVIDGEINE